MPEAYQPVPVEVQRLRGPATPAQAPRVELLYAVPAAPHRELARLHARGAPGLNVRYVYGELREEAAALGADALVLVDVREEVRPPLRAPLSIGRPASLAGGVLYEIRALAIEYLPPSGR